MPKFTAQITKYFLPIAFFLVIVVALFQVFPKKIQASNSLEIYTDGISQGWTSWSWSSSINFQNPAPTQGGSHSIWASVFPWGAIYFHKDTSIDISAFSTFRFSIQPSADNEKFQIIVYDENDRIAKTLSLSNYGGNPKAGNYTTYTIPVSDFGVTKIKGIAFQDATGTTQQPIFLDTIGFISSVAVPVPISTLAPTPTAIPTPTTTLTQAPTPTAFPTVAPSVSNSNVFIDSLGQSWLNWSWGASVDFNSQNAFKGTRSIAFTPSPWAGLYLHSDSGVDTAKYPFIHFYLKPSLNNQNLKIGIYDQNNNSTQNFVSLSSFGGQLVSGQWKEFSIPLSSLSAGNKTIKGFVIQESMGNNQNTIYLDEVYFTSGVAVQSSSPTPILKPIIPTPTATPSISVGSTGYTTSENKIYKNGSLITLRGVNWFGAETDAYVFHGLWARNWKEMISQMKSVGFNAIRVPVCPRTLKGVPVTSIDYSKNPDLVGLNSLQVLDKILAELNNQQMFALLDHHRPDCQAISGLWYTPSYSESQWITDLQFMANRYKSLQYFIGIDLKNEPHGATWGTGNRATDWNTAAELAGKAVLSVAPNLLIFVEGIGWSNNCSSTIAPFWGENLEPFRCAGISTNSIPKEKLILSPHVYGPDVNMQNYFSDSNFPSNMSNVWNTHFGFLADQGYTLVPGEWGGKYGIGNPLDVTLQNALVTYLSSKRICSSFYWSWNPNSGDTGGILQDDWKTPWASKLNLLRTYYQNCQ